MTKNNTIRKKKPRQGHPLIKKGLLLTILLLFLLGIPVSYAQEPVTSGQKTASVTTAAYDESEITDMHPPFISYTVPFDLGNGAELRFNPTLQTITACNVTKDCDIVVPSQINGITVLHLGDACFHNGILLSNVNGTLNGLGEGGALFSASYTKNLSDYSSSGMSHVQSITLPNTITSIGKQTFGLSSVKKIEIPGSVTSIGEQAFTLCEHLESIILHDGLTTIGKSAFSSIYGAYRPLPISNVSIPNTVTDLGEYAFSGSIYLTGVTLSDSMASISERTFYNCIRLKSVQVPKSVKVIEKGAFEHCIKLAAVSLPEGLKVIGENAFLYGDFTNIIIPATVTEIDANAFTWCNRLTDVWFAGDAPGMGSDVFKGAAPGFTLHYLAEKQGFTNPLNGYKTAVYTPDMLPDITASANEVDPAISAPKGEADMKTVPLIDLGTLGGKHSTATFINNMGQVAGYSYMVQDDRGPIHAFLWEYNKMTDLGTLAGTSSFAYSVNNNRQVVGQSTTTVNGESHAFLWENGAMKDLGTLGGVSSGANSINDKGQVVGWSNYRPGDYSVSNRTRHAFLWENGKMTDLGTLGGDNSEACCINNEGAIVGYSTTPNGYRHAFLWQDGIMTDLDPTEFKVESSALSINDKGQIVGCRGVTNPRSDWSSPSDSLLWQDGQMMVLMHGTGYIGASAVNNNGLIVGLQNNVRMDVMNGFPYMVKNGVITILNIPNVGGITSVNDDGLAVGEFTSPEVTSHACIYNIDAKPLPEAVKQDTSDVVFADISVMQKATWQATTIPGADASSTPVVGSSSGTSTDASSGTSADASSGTSADASSGNSTGATTSTMRSPGADSSSAVAATDSGPGNPVIVIIVIVLVILIGLLSLVFLRNFRMNLTILKREGRAFILKKRVTVNVADSTTKIDIESAVEKAKTDDLILIFEETVSQQLRGKVVEITTNGHSIIRHAIPDNQTGTIELTVRSLEANP